MALAGMLVAAQAGAITLPPRVAAVAAGLERAGYSDVRVTERIFGGFAIQARKGPDFAMIALDADGRMLDHAELFRDGDGDGVYETDETLGQPGRATLRRLVVDSLETPPATEARDTPAGTDVMPGFQQGMTTLFATGGLRVDATQRLGSGGVAREEVVQSLDMDEDGGQRRGEQRMQQQTLAGVGVLSLSASTAGRGGVQGEFAPLTVRGGGTQGEFAPLAFGGGGTDLTSLTVASGGSSITVGKGQDIYVNGKSRDQITQDVLATVNGNVPDGAALRQQIISTAPTAESIRAGIVAPSAPAAP